MRIKGLSPSSYNCYSQCEFKWLLTNNLKFSDPPGPAAILGHIGHRLFETMSLASMANVDRSHKVFDAAAMWPVWFNYYQKKNPEEAARIKNDKIKKLCKGIIALMDTPYSPVTDKTIAAEQYARIPIQEDRFIIDPNATNPLYKYATVRGIIDRIDQVDKDTIEIIDYKCGQRKEFLSNNKEKIDEISLRSSIQPRIYYMAAKKLFPDIKNILVTFVYVTDGGPITALFDDDDIEETKDKIYKRFSAIKFNESPERNLSWKCRFCPHNRDKSGICDEVWEEIKDFGLEFVTNKYELLNERVYN